MKGERRGDGRFTVGSIDHDGSGELRSSLDHRSGSLDDVLGLVIGSSGSTSKDNVNVL
jgi:hypothetical protein